MHARIMLHTSDAFLLLVDSFVLALKFSFNTYVICSLICGFVINTIQPNGEEVDVKRDDLSRALMVCIML